MDNIKIEKIIVRTDINLKVGEKIKCYEETFIVAKREKILAYYRYELVNVSLNWVVL